jgi:putative SOS response-associated peptidase YedK
MHRSHWFSANRMTYRARDSRCFAWSTDMSANLAPMPGVVDFKQLFRMEPDGGTTNIRKVKSKHWTRWLGPENRCVVPFNSFSEFNKAEGGDIWFARDKTRPLACFAGIWTKWTSVRKVKEGETTNDILRS